MSDKTKVYFNSAINAERYVRIKMDAAKMGVTIKSYIAEVVSRHADTLTSYGVIEDGDSRQGSLVLDCKDE